MARSEVISHFTPEACLLAEAPRPEEDFHLLPQALPLLDFPFCFCLFKAESHGAVEAALELTV